MEVTPGVVNVDGSAVLSKTWPVRRLSSGLAFVVLVQGGGQSLLHESELPVPAKPYGSKNLGPEPVESPV